MSAGRIALLIVGSIVALLALALLAGGAVLFWAHTSERDAEGYYSTGNERFHTQTYALVSDDLDIGTDGPDWLFRKGRLGTIRLRGTSAEPGKQIFIGIARTTDVNGYLGNVSRARVSDVGLDPFSVEYEPLTGNATPEPPQSRTFWAESASGAGPVTVRWEVAKGDWSIIVMNTDASRGVAADISLGAKVGFIFWIALGLVIIGALLGAGAALLIYFAARRRPPTAPERPAPAPEPVHGRR
jgi:hypothetical protein